MTLNDKSYPVCRASSSTPTSSSATGVSSASTSLVWACCTTSCRRKHLRVINPEPPAHWRKNRGGQLKTWMTTLKEDLARLSGPDDFGLRPGNRDWMTIGIDWAQDRRAWAATVRDAVVAMDAGATAPRRLPSQVSSSKYSTWFECRCFLNCIFDPNNM